MTVPTFDLSIEGAQCFYAGGFLVHNTRKDRMEFLVYDLFGDVISDISRKDVQQAGYVCPVVVRLVPTRFEAPWYSEAPAEERDHTRLVEAMCGDEDRNRLVRRVCLELAAERLTPALLFSHRREHARRFAMDLLPADGISAGLMIGGDGDVEAFRESVEQLREGRLAVGCGTFQSIGTGIDVPRVFSGVVATPLGQNRQFFGQVRGRLARPFPGKERGHMYYLWDRAVFPRQPRNLLDWNEGAVEVYDGSSWVRAGGDGEPLRRRR